MHFNVEVFLTHNLIELKSKFSQLISNALLGTRSNNIKIYPHRSQMMPSLYTQAWEDMLCHKASWQYRYLKEEALFSVYKEASVYIRVYPLFYPT